MVIKLNSSGVFEWAKTYGGVNEDGDYSIQQTNDGGYIGGGYTTSYSVPVVGGGIESFILKLDGTGNLDPPWSGKARVFRREEP